MMETKTTKPLLFFPFILSVSIVRKLRGKAPCLTWNGGWRLGGMVFFVSYIKEGEEESAFVLFPVSSCSTNEIKNVSN